MHMCIVFVEQQVNMRCRITRKNIDTVHPNRHINIYIYIYIYKLKKKTNHRCFGISATILKKSHPWRLPLFSWPANACDQWRQTGSTWGDNPACVAKIERRGVRKGVNQNQNVDYTVITKQQSAYLQPHEPPPWLPRLQGRNKNRLCMWFLDHIDWRPNHDDRMVIHNWKARRERV